MNYIKHLNKVMEAFSQDNRLTSNHISIYLALFKNANDNRFENPFPIHRPEVMKASKITSFSTYTRCLQQLHEWSYIEYKTSHNPKVGTQIHLYDFSNTVDKSSSNTFSNTLGNTLPYIENTKMAKSVKDTPPTFDQVVSFFLEQKFPESEAKKFYNHYQSNGWLVGGKTPMKDWQAAAEKWISNSHNFKNHGTESKPKGGQLNTSNDKDYSEPL